MANIKTLKPIKKGELSKEEAKKRGSKGGKKSVESRRKRKLFKETILECLNTQAPENIAEKLKQNFPELTKNKIDLQTAMILSLIKNSINNAQNSVQSFVAIRDTIGEKPVEKIDNKQSGELIIKIKGLKK